MANQGLTRMTKSWLGVIAGVCTGAQPEPSRPPDQPGAGVSASFLPPPVAASAIAIDKSILAAPRDGTANMAACPFQPDRRPSIDEMSAIFRQAWHKSTASIFAIAAICDYIERNYQGEERQDLIRRLPIERTRLGRLARLGRDQRLPRIAHLLPPSASTLCILSELSDDQLAAALAAEMIHPGATRKAIAAWRTRYRAACAGDHNPDAAAVVTFAIIRLPSNLPQARVEEVNDLLRPLHEFAEVKVCYPQADAWLRPKVRQLITTTKAARLAGRPDHISETDWRRQQWPFSAKDVAIGPRTSFNRMRAIADRIGQAQAFAAILEQA